MYRAVPLKCVVVAQVKGQVLCDRSKSAAPRPYARTNVACSCLTISFSSVSLEIAWVLRVRLALCTLLHTRSQFRPHGTPRKINTANRTRSHQAIVLGYLSLPLEHPCIVHEECDLEESLLESLKCSWLPSRSVILGSKKWP